MMVRNVAKMEDAKVEIDNGKEESALPDTLYQWEYSFKSTFAEIFQNPQKPQSSFIFV